MVSTTSLPKNYKNLNRAIRLSSSLITILAPTLSVVYQKEKAKIDIDAENFEWSLSRVPERPI